jgi:hypothetical protein
VFISHMKNISLILLVKNAYLNWVPSRVRAAQNARLGEKFYGHKETVFIHTPQAVDLSRENTFAYGGFASRERHIANSASEQ